MLRKGCSLVWIPGSRSCVAFVAFLLAITVMSPTASANSPDGPAHVGTNAIVIDAGSGAILYEHNATERVAPASLTKIFTSYFAIADTPMQRRMVVEKNDLVGEASAGLNAGDNLSFETLLHGLMLASGNDAAMTIARNVGTSRAPAGLNGVQSFMTHVNEQIQRMGLHDTHLVNPHGLDDEGHYSSARDIAALTLHALRAEPDFLRVLASPGYSGEGLEFAQRNQLFGNYPGAVGGKTGITDDAGYCLMGIANRDGRTIISVIMGSTSDAWYSDTMALLDYGFATPVSAAQSTVSVNVDPVVSDLAAAPAIHGFSVQASGDETASVRPATETKTTSWDALRWPVGATLAMLVGYVCSVQTRALIALRKRPPTRGRRRTSRRSPVPSRPSVPDFGDTLEIPVQSTWERSSSSWSVSVGD